MSNFNQVTLLGRLGKDPDIRSTQNGVNVANFRLATSESWKDKAGEKVEKTEWHNIVAFDKLADVIGKYVFKGDLLFVQGRLQTRKWQDKEGQDRYTTEIVVSNMQLMPNKNAGESRPEPARTRARAPAPEPAPAEESFDDDIPF